ncbi:RNA-directed DNA polymerase from mobile element jockey-like 45 [Homarus americanus]|uniref:RNA-directed DNA polymerase from mobile element jockey-like 45 n=1 Tax=Homarus americanus TaxID=6706 RepID=A0A8J5JL71_HOMAM|nr:RNA-directed DNA polymerase from mobile element jockey-like 45 [Homarus americanus]
MLQMSEIWTSPIQVPQKSEMWLLQPKPQDINVYSKTQGRNHHDSEVPKLWKETSRLEHIIPREERADGSCNGQDSTTKLNRSTPEHIGVGSTATENSQPNTHSTPNVRGFLPCSPPPGYRIKLKSPGQNQSCTAVKAQNTEVMVENTILPGALQPPQATTQLNTPPPANLQVAFTEEQIKQMIIIMIVTVFTIIKKQDTSTTNIINAVMTQLTENMQEDQTPKTPQLQITQWNVQGLSNKRHTVQAVAKAKNIAVFILQETLMSKDQQFRLPGYQQYSVPKGSNSHGSMILVKATIPSSEVEPVHCGDE